MKSLVSPGFIYDKQFGTWSRVLAKVGECHGALGDMVILEVTPPSPGNLSSWTRTVEFPILLIEANRAVDIQIHEELPTRIYKLMQDNLGANSAHRLVHDDVLPKIDWYMYHNSSSTLLKHFRRILEWEIRPIILFELEVKDSRDPGGTPLARIEKVYATSLERAIEIYYSSKKFNKEFRLVISATLIPK